MLDSFRKQFQSSKKGHKEEGWFGVSFRPENFIPGLIVGFMLGLLIDLSGTPRSNSKGNKTLSNSGKQQQQSLISDCGDELKMVLVVRQDLKMKAGKIASQCAHAATGIYAELMQSQRSLLSQWEQYGQPKIVVTCKNQQEMFWLDQRQFLPSGLNEGGEKGNSGPSGILSLHCRKRLVDSVTGKLNLL